MINIQALFTDETQSFKTPYEPAAGDKVTLTFRTLKNDVNNAYVVINGRTRAMKRLPRNVRLLFDNFHLRAKARKLLL